MKEIPTIGQVVRATAKVTNVPEKALLDPKHRAHHVTRARHIAQYLARTLSCKTWPQITEAFSQAHPSAYCGAKKVEAYLANNNTHVKTVIADVTKALKR